MKKKFLAILTIGLFMVGMIGIANATIYTGDVDAKIHSSTDWTIDGLDLGVSLTTGQNFLVSADNGDLWSAGANPRWSNADGLIGDLLATGSDESGQLAGTPIGASYSNWSQDGLTAPFGSLVGKIGTTFALLGTNFSGAAWDTGNLLLYYWDSNAVDNADYITVTVNDDPGGGNPVPEPATMLLFGLGLLGLAGINRRKK